MSIPLTINGAVFNYPVVFNTGWGIDATGWAQAVTSGMLQKAGGTFTLTADVDFGASFGLKAPYFISKTANPATVGTIRLASADPGVVFRNNANNGNLILTTNSSDNLTYTGSLLLPNENALKLQDAGSVHTINVKSPATTANYTITLPPDAGSAGQVLRTDGAGITTWINAAGGGTVNSGTAGQIGYYATSSTTISGSPLLSQSGNVLTLAGTGSCQLSIVATGVATSSINFTQNGTTNQLLNFIDGAFSVTDSDNARTFFSYTRGSGGLVTLVTPLAMGSNKITGLANGSTTSDATAFGQVQYGFQNAVQFSSLGAASVSSVSYATTGIAVTITPTSASSRIKISVTGSIATASGHITIFRNSTNLAGSDKDFGFYTDSSSLGYIYIDSPATTSAVTYTIYAKGTVTVGGASILTTLIAEELR